MRSASATLLTGAASGSLGSAWVRQYRQRGNHEPVIVFDKEPDSMLHELRNVQIVKHDLNPLVYDYGYKRFAERLRMAMDECPASSNGICTVVLCAGTYDSGRLAETTVEARERLLGVNVCGQVEVLHAVLSLNQRRGVDSSSDLSYIQIGSLHGLTASGGRSVYAGTKAFGLDLCISLSSGREVKRVIYVAPGPIDTPMLHRNHWVSKVGGCSRFFEHVRALGPLVYKDVFEKCEDEAFRKAISTEDWDREMLADKYERYKERRVSAFSQRDGVLSVADMAQGITELVSEESSCTSGVYVFTAPGGEVSMERMSFGKMLRR